MIIYLVQIVPDFTESLLALLSYVFPVKIGLAWVWVIWFNAATMSEFSNKIPAAGLEAATLVAMDGRPTVPGLYKRTSYWSFEMVNGELKGFQLSFPQGQRSGRCDSPDGMAIDNWYRLTWPVAEPNPNVCLGWDITGWDLLEGMPSKPGYYLFITEDKPPEIAHRTLVNTYVEDPPKNCFKSLSEEQSKAARWAKFNPETAMSARCWQVVRHIESPPLGTSHFLSKKCGFMLRKPASKLYLTKVLSGRVEWYLDCGTANRASLDYQQFSPEGEWFKFQMHNGSNVFWLAGMRRGVIELPIENSSLEQNRYYAHGYQEGVSWLGRIQGKTLTEVLKHASQRQIKPITKKQARSLRKLFNVPEPRST